MEVLLVHSLEERIKAATCSGYMACEIVEGSNWYSTQDIDREVSSSARLFSFLAPSVFAMKGARDTRQGSDRDLDAGRPAPAPSRLGIDLAVGKFHARKVDDGGRSPAELETVPAED